MSHGAGYHEVNALRPEATALGDFLARFLIPDCLSSTKMASQKVTHRTAANKWKSFWQALISASLAGGTGTWLLLEPGGSCGHLQINSSTREQRFKEHN